MEALAYVAMFVALIGGILLFLYYRHERENEQYLIEKLRRNPVYQDMLPLVRRAAARDLDQVRIERDRIVFTLVSPPATLGVYELQQRGHMQMRPTRTRLMAELLAEDIELLRDRSKYSLVRYRIFRANGTVDYGYLYTIRSNYKDRIMRARQRLDVRTWQ